jgi:trigger factor
MFMVQTIKAIECSITQELPHFYQAIITIPAQFVNQAYIEGARAHQDIIQTQGFAKGTVPLEYIIKNYKSHLTSHVQEFLFSYFVLSLLFDTIHEKKLLLAGDPRLKEIHVEPEQDAIYIFELTTFSPLELKSWKHFPFKPPKRKNYKDIDRQVEVFMQEESEAELQYTDTVISPNDWVCFDIHVVNQNREPLFVDYHENFWLKIGTEAADEVFHETFLNQKMGEPIYSDNIAFQECFSHAIETKSLFSIDIKDVLPYRFFSLDSLRRHFKIGTKKDLQKKIIEVFSYRNDLTQRRAMVEETFKLLLAKHHIDAPQALVLRQQEEVLKSVQTNPDYHVYKTERTFEENVKKLALKQVRESLLIDSIAHAENLAVSHDDLHDYLNLTKRNRMKEFLYFSPPDTKVNGQEVPISSALLKKQCLREKTLNYVIHHLTKK